MAHAHDAGALVVGRFTLTLLASFTRLRKAARVWHAWLVLRISLFLTTTLPLGPMVLYIALPQPLDACHPGSFMTVSNDQSDYIKLSRRQGRHRVNPSNQHLADHHPTFWS